MTSQVQNLSEFIFTATRWIRVWLYVIGFSCLVIGFSVSDSIVFLQYGSGLIFLSILLYALRIVLKQKQPRKDDYAASIHRAGIEQFFNKTVPNTRLQNSLAEIMQRTTFSRPSSVQPMNELYETLTVVVILTTIAATVQIVVSPIGVSLIAVFFIFVYLSDSWFSLRSRIYFRRRSLESGGELDSNHLEHMVEVFANQLGVQPPEIVYTESESMLAGETNGYFVQPQLYVSTQLLERQNHIQTGIIAHEMAHIYLDESSLWSYRYFQFFIPFALLTFAAAPVTVWSVAGLFVALVCVSIIITRQRHTEEFDADEVAATLTQPEFIILAILEFSNHNPFIDELSSLPQAITHISNTHPQVKERITRLSKQT